MTTNLGRSKAAFRGRDDDQKLDDIGGLEQGKMINEEKGEKW